PVRKIAGLEKLERQVLWPPAVDERALRDLTARELARHRVARQETVRCVRQRFAGAEHPAAIRRAQPVAIRHPYGCGETGYACGCREPGGDQFSPRDLAHPRSFQRPARPVIMARMRLLNPARQTITTWTRRKRTRNTETKK